MEANDNSFYSNFFIRLFTNSMFCRFLLTTSIQFVFLSMVYVHDQSRIFVFKVKFPDSMKCFICLRKFYFILDFGSSPQRLSAMVVRSNLLLQAKTKMKQNPQP